MEDKQTSQPENAAVEENKQEAQAEKPKEPEKKDKLSVRLARELLDYAEMYVMSILVVLLLFTFGIRLCTVTGDSMVKTLMDGENLIVSNINYEPATGDILIFHQTSEIYDRFNEPIVKRVIATEGQWVDINRGSGTVTVYDENFENPVVLDESAYRYLDSGEWEIPFAMSFPVQVPKDHLFVMGDNRNNSSDSSTSTAIGFVDERRILGRVICRITPREKFGPVE